jgi:hypothetical protein
MKYLVEPGGFDIIVGPSSLENEKVLLEVK